MTDSAGRDILELASVADQFQVGFRVADRTAPAPGARLRGTWRCVWHRPSKSTSWASNSGPSTQANWLRPPTCTRQPPHMPVPSTMIGFRLTSVLMPCGRVVSATARIIGIGPMASTRSIFPSARDQRLQLVRDQPFFAVAAVVRGHEHLVADGAGLVLEDQEVLWCGRRG